ncbi:MAG TPA: Maf family protein [Methylomirabilota bacterium]|nr:Maf family protein [Methylomirabilota bacterium]
MSSKPALVLASASPRRQDLLAGLGIPFTVQPSRVAEVHPPGPAAAAVAAVALDKARAVAREWTGGPAVVLGADTEVVLDGRYLGKPRDAADAARMLRELSGRTHEVVTGLALVDAPSGREETLAVTTRVTMIDASAEEIAAYVATGEPLDKAGAYAIQGQGARLVARVDGCFTNVVGLPVETTRRLLKRWGLV